MSLHITLFFLIVDLISCSKADCLVSDVSSCCLGQVYMLEIYQDSLIDLLLPKNAGKQRKLEIKKDSKVMHPH